MKKSFLFPFAVGAVCLATAAAQAQVAAGTYVGSVQFQNSCSNGGQGSSATPARLAVSGAGVLTYLFTDIYAIGTDQSGQPVSQGGYSTLKADTNGTWTSQDMLYGGGYNGYGTQAGTWTQTFTTSGGVLSASGTFDIVVNGTVVCSEPTSAVFIAAPKGF